MGIFGEALASNQVLLVKLDGSKYSLQLMELIKELAAISSKILYIAASKPSTAIKKAFEGNKIDPSTFSFIEANTRGLELTELGISLTSQLPKNELAVIDSVEPLFLFVPNESLLIRFLYETTNKLRTADKKLVICTQRESGHASMREVYPFVDAVVDYA